MLWFYTLTAKGPEPETLDATEPKPKGPLTPSCQRPLTLPTEQPAFLGVYLRPRRPTI